MTADRSRAKGGKVGDVSADLVTLDSVAKVAATAPTPTRNKPSSLQRTKLQRGRSAFICCGSGIVSTSENTAPPPASKRTLGGDAKGEHNNDGDAETCLASVLLGPCIGSYGQEKLMKDIGIT